MAEAPAPYPGEFLRAVIGSTVHGLAQPETDDLDLLGICIEDPEKGLRLSSKPFEQYQYRSAGGQNPSQPGDVDLIVYTLRKYLRLAAAGNPTILNALFVPPQFRTVDSPLADELRGLIPHIVSRDCGSRFLGYLHHQRERLMGLRGQKRTGSHRQRYFVADPDTGALWDAKYGSHIIRLGLQGVELLRTGWIELPMTWPQRTKVRLIREGAYPKSFILQWAESLESDIRWWTSHSDLPKEPNVEYLAHWMREKYLDSWTSAPMALAA